MQGRRSRSGWSGDGLTTFGRSFGKGRCMVLYVCVACLRKEIVTLCGHNLSTSDGPDHLKFASYGPVMHRLQSVQHQSQAYTTL